MTHRHCTQCGYTAPDRPGPPTTPTRAWATDSLCRDCADRNAAPLRVRMRCVRCGSEWTAPPGHPDDDDSPSVTHTLCKHCGPAFTENQCRTLTLIEIVV